MTLDPPLSDAELLRRLEERAGRVTEGELIALAREVYSAPVPTFRNAPKRGAMNKTEALYADQLEGRRIVTARRSKALRGGVVAWRYGSISLRLATRTWYRPDFLVWVHPSGQLEIHEVKGHWEDDARAKFKIAAELYPMFVFRAIRRVRGEFHVIETLND